MTLTDKLTYSSLYIDEENVLWRQQNENDDYIPISENIDGIDFVIIKNSLPMGTFTALSKEQVFVIQPLVKKFSHRLTSNQTKNNINVLIDKILQTTALQRAFDWKAMHSYVRQFVQAKGPKAKEKILKKNELHLLSC